MNALLTAAQKLTEVGQPTGEAMSYLIDGDDVEATPLIEEATSNVESATASLDSIEEELESCSSSSSTT